MLRVFSTLRLLKPARPCIDAKCRACRHKTNLLLISVGEKSFRGLNQPATTLDERAHVGVCAKPVLPKSKPYSVAEYPSAPRRNRRLMVNVCSRRRPI